MHTPTLKELTKRQLGEALAKAREIENKARLAYNAEWKRDGTAKNYPRVDVKLDAYNDAIAAREALEAEQRRREY